jgi:hypothetical protein
MPASMTRVHDNLLLAGPLIAPSEKQIFYGISSPNRAITARAGLLQHRNIANRPPAGTSAARREQRLFYTFLRPPGMDPVDFPRPSSGTQEAPPPHAALADPAHQPGAPDPFAVWRRRLMHFAAYNMPLLQAHTY